MNKKLKLKVKVFFNIACKYSDTKDYFEENLKEVCEVKDCGKCNLFCCLPLSNVLLSLSFWVDKWFTFSCISYSFLEGEQMRYSNIYDSVKF